MKNADRHIHEKVQRLCRSIGERADNLEKLQPLVFQLSEVLTQARHERWTVEAGAQPHEDNPFDKIIVDSPKDGHLQRGAASGGR